MKYDQWKRLTIGFEASEVGCFPIELKNSRYFHCDQNKHEQIQLFLPEHFEEFALDKLAQGEPPLLDEIFFIHDDCTNEIENGDISGHHHDVLNRVLYGCLMNIFMKKIHLVHKRIRFELLERI